MPEINSREALRALTDDDLVRIVGNKGVGEQWAKMAAVKYTDLGRGMPRALRSVRTAIMTRHAEFAHVLSHGWAVLIDPSVERHPDLEDLDEVTLRAAAAAICLGASGAIAMLCAVADNNQMSDAQAVRERFDELCDIAENPPQPEAVAESEDEAEGQDDEPTEAHDQAVNDLTEEAGTPGGLTLSDIQRRATQLRDQVEGLVTILREAADAIEQRRPASHIGDAPDKWSREVKALLDASAGPSEEQNVGDLNALIEHVTALTAERAEQDSARRRNALLALRMVDVLREEGREEMIAETIAPFGFTSLQEVEDAAGTTPGELEKRPERALEADPQDGSAEDGEDGEDSSSGDDEKASTGDDAPEEVPPTGEDRQVQGGVLDPSPTEISAEQPAPTESAEKPASPEPAGKAGALAEPRTPVITADAVTTASTTESSTGDWPWDEGDPPLIGQLLLEGREALAYHVAVSADEVRLRLQLLQFACAAAHCSPAGIELSLLPSDAEIRPSSTESLLLLAASLRAGLRLGYAPLGLQTLLDSADAALTDSSLRDVLHAAAAAVQRGHGRRQPASGPSTEEMAGRWAKLGLEAGDELAKLRQKNLRQRGSKVLRHLVRDDQPLGDALSSAAALTAQGVASASSPGWAQIEEIAGQLRDQGDRERILQTADAAVCTPQQRGRPIDGQVKVQLDELLRDAGDKLARLLAVRRAILTAGDLKDIAVSDDLERALSQAPTTFEVHSVGDAAVANFVQWLRSDEVDPTAESLQEVVDAALLEVFEIPRDDHGRPLRWPTREEIARVLNPRDPDEVVDGYLEKGNIAAARDFIAARGLEGVGYDDEILQAIKRAKANFGKAYGNAEEGVARLRALYQDELARELGESIRQIAEAPRNDRFDLAIDRLQAITAKAEEALRAEREILKRQVGELACDEASKQRVLQRIEARDEPLAVYFLSVLRTGGTLQEVEPLSGDDFSCFVPRIVDIAAEAQAAGEDALAAVREALEATATPSDRFLRDGLVAWQNLKTRKRSGDDFKRSLNNALRMVGLLTKAQGGYRGEVTRTTASGYATIRVGANPVDRSYVPQFGSQALGEYDVTLVWDTASPSRLMDFISEGNRNRPNIVLYFGVLSLAERRHLRTLTRTTAGGKGFSPLVIDEAVIGWLSHLAEPGWRFTQRVTLPFTTLNPYQPNAAGEVPEEVFVGRNEERARIENPTGSMFVYGGRQLGKSALLRRVEHLFSDLRPADSGLGVAGKAAVYVDLKAAGIGEAHQPAQLWPVLGERLHKVGILTAKAAPRTAHAVTSGIQAWLGAEDSNQLLLLLDEADNFLTADSATREGDVGGFPVLQALKEVMEQSRRRFKAVFAGLHQVQRFFDASNTPVAHGGDAIPIGPLRTHDACDLVVSPLGALGYRFENPELVLRLLLVTNYQASLVQIVCDALVQYLQKRQIPEDGGRMIITADDVRDVCADPKVRDLIAQRFRWTINLDSRYRVIALVVALNSIGADPAVRFSVDELREECEVWWPEGFSPDQLSRNEFERYLVEMQGLGVLQQPEPDLWALRSPSIIQMLGTRDRLEKELEEAQAHLERPLEYNPTMARHIMGDREGVAAQRSPLTDYELTALLKDADVAQVVFGSPALGIERVVDVVQRQAESDTEQPAIVVSSAQAPELKRAGAGGKRVHIIVDLTGAKPDGNLAHLCREAAARKSVTATVVIGPAWLDSLDSLGDIPLHKLRRWSTAGLRAWYGSPFDSPVERARLYRVTSGWPKLVEEVMTDVAKGRAPHDALERLTRRLTSPDRAKQTLADTGMNTQIAKAWVKSIPFSADEDGIDQLPVSVEDITQALELSGAELLGRLESLDVAFQDGDKWFLDRVILGAAATLYPGTE